MLNGLKKVLENGSANLDPIFQGKVVAGDPPTAYICQKFACQAPVHDLPGVTASWASLEMQAQTGDATGRSAVRPPG